MRGKRERKRKRERERARAPARFDFTGWVRNNSANYYSTPVHIDRYVAPIYILRGYDPKPTPPTFPTPSNPGINPGKAGRRGVGGDGDRDREIEREKQREREREGGRRREKERKRIAWEDESFQRVFMEQKNIDRSRARAH